MSVKTYSLVRDGEKQLTKDFRVREFRCKDGSDKILLSPETVKIIQSVRDYFGKPVKINSAYRTPCESFAADPRCVRQSCDDQFGLPNTDAQ